MKPQAAQRTTVVERHHSNTAGLQQPETKDQHLLPAVKAAGSEVPRSEGPLRLFRNNASLNYRNKGRLLLLKPREALKIEKSAANIKLQCQW
jgi:hypothetical protein